ncbi:MAG: multifunctional CCA tRNA nucleotidyl transferase/2'3'-cyclic phosphodiesterase/2'nucleotidase/phosphatase [Marinobacter sp.]|uniref:multifunctional CCA tRNA nucleotidyl transferase/2'3'-cyclic phosphodiesterase/2'nucleotidase/phosphatase n=1 Tax=Marinobacter sp. TaxID=50741 RepID=UPI00299D1734|nr:multifunctional CCA tRNA nucleotidyl transferase/2'3'-cyclic phosphodiesterase/2'nucleotidase/phosphatase [Marinobacter sp.]MDX1634215.1 multifunctional CCA tRNA nucleotidyl transferase/2'3'-cyclic phosphodiesterase/2'nucleotidase/phosphatase [Marinobacter sp.]
MEIYLVGGAVRDALLGLPVKDRDWVVVGATPEDMLARGYRQVGADFPVFLHPDTNEEYALARTERKQGHGYHGFTVYSAPDVTLEDDLRRRDLTINAMARDSEGQLVDPFGGQQDLVARSLRHVSPAFAEDPLRVLRTARFAARFASLGFEVADTTRTLMAAMVSAGEMEHLVPERVWQELQRALLENRPAVFFQVLDQCGALGRLMPALSTPANLSTGLACLSCLAGSDASGPARFAGLVGALPEAEVHDLSRALKAPNDYRDLALMTARHADALRRADGAEAQLAVLEACDVWRRPERFDELLTVCQCLEPPLADSLASRLREAEAEAWSVDARKLMAEGHQGKALGQAIRQERLRRIQSLNDTESGTQP